MNSRVRRHIIGLGSLIIGYFLVVPIGHAQPQQLIFENYTVDDGLSNGSIRSMLQDRQGFMWFGTTYSVSKFDGYAFTNYLPIPGDTTSYTGGNVFALLEDRKGAIWIGTQNGLNRFDPQTGTVSRYNNISSDTTGLLRQTIRSLLEDRDGIIWINSSRGLVRFDPDNDSVTLYRQESDRMSLRLAHLGSSMVEDKAGALWFATNEGVLKRLDRKQNTVITYNNGPPDTHSLPAAQVTDLLRDQSGTLWISSLGLSRYDPATDGFTTFYPDPEHLTTDTEDPLFFNNFINVLYEDQAGNLWVGTRSGLLLFDRETETFTAFKRNPDQPGSLNEDWVTTILQDRFGALWVGTRFLGLNRADMAATLISTYVPVPNEPQNQRNYSQGILEDRNGNLWVGNLGGGLERTNPLEDTFQEYRHDPADSASLTQGNAQAILEDATGAIWIGTGFQYNFGSPGGLSHYDPETDTFKRIVFDPDRPTTQVVALDESPSKPGILWIGTDRGLYRYDTRTSTSTHYRNDPTNPYSLDNNLVYSLREDRSGTLWVGTFTGLNRLNRPHEALMADAETEVFTRFSPSDGGNEIVAIYEDQKMSGVLWIGSRGGAGLIRFDTNTEEFSFFTEANSGLANNITYGILGDADDNLWLSTQDGLSRFNPATREMKNYGISQGLLSREFNSGSFHRGHSGALYFGGINGYIAFKPEDITGNPYPPELVITDLKLFNSSIKPTPDGILQGPISTAMALTLAYDENDLTFDYVGLHFSNPEKIEYAYWLENYDDSWRYVDSQRTATYTNLDPGTYIFHVKAANSDGVWSEEGTSLVVTIRPPWWQTWWAYGFYGLFLIGGVISGDRYQRRRLMQKERERARARELEQAREIEKAYTQLKTTQTQLVQAEKMASLGQLTAGIAHEIKNPLNFINNFAEVNEELAQELGEALEAGNTENVRALLGDLQSNAHVIAQHGKRADGIVHAMMQHASGGSTERIKTDINQLVSEHIDLAFHGKRAQVPDLMVDIKRDLESDIGKVEVVPQEIGRVLLNLLGNAFDAVYAHSFNQEADYNPGVTVTTLRVDRGIEIRVTDNGPGIPADIRDRIFEPFFTTKPTGEGTGLGLSLSYDIVTQGHGGTLFVESNEGKGATFVIRLPVV